MSRWESGIDVDATEALNRLEALERVLTKPGLKKMAQRGADLVDKETAKAFRTQSDPNTGRPWAPRKHDYRWPMLQHTGTLRGSIRKHGKALDHVAFIGAKIADASMIGGRRKGTSSYHMIAGAVYYGRKRGRSSKGTKLKGTIAGTGQTPPRPYSGLSANSARDLRRYGERLVRNTGHRKSGRY